MPLGAGCLSPTMHSQSKDIQRQDAAIKVEAPHANVHSFRREIAFKKFISVSETTNVPMFQSQILYTIN